MKKPPRLNEGVDRVFGHQVLGHSGKLLTVNKYVRRDRTSFVFIRLEEALRIELLIQISIFISTSKRITDCGPEDSRRSYYTLNVFNYEHLRIQRQPPDFFLLLNSEVGTNLLISTEKVGYVEAFQFC